MNGFEHAGRLGAKGGVVTVADINSADAQLNMPVRRTARIEPRHLPARC